MLFKKNKIIDVSLSNYYNKRNKIIIVRETGGVGDILMHRMIFQNIKDLIPESHLTFSCPKIYYPLVQDNPYLDDFVDKNYFNAADYAVYYNTTSACTRYESSIAPKSNLHRSDIWALRCGIKLIKHDMNFILTNEEQEEANKELNNLRNRDGKIVLISPTSAMIVKNLLDSQLSCLIEEIINKKMCPIGIHIKNIPIFEKYNVPQILNINFRKWLAIINKVDYVISVDTGTFHAAGGLKKPLMGIFTFADGLVYGKYYDFILVQKHRNYDKDWSCGPCYLWGNCSKSKTVPKPCLTEITNNMILEGLEKLINK